MANKREPSKRGSSGNPAKRAQQDARQLADRVEGGDSSKATNKVVAIYHEMHADDDFDTTADMIMQIVRAAATERPGEPRHLYLDIEGHRNGEGGLDHDAFELVGHFLVGFLGRWLTEISTPLGQYRFSSQQDDVPDHLAILPGPDLATRAETLRSQAEAFGQAIHDSETGELVDRDGSRRRR